MKISDADADGNVKTERNEDETEQSEDFTEEDESELFQEEENEDDDLVFKIVDEYTSGAVTIDELAETYERDVKSIFELLSGANLPDDYSSRKEGNCKVFPLEKQRILIFQVLKCWFDGETAHRYLDTKMILARAVEIRDALKLRALPISEGTIRGFLDVYNIRLSEQTKLPDKSAGKHVLESAVIAWYKQESEKRVISSQMIMDKAFEIVEQKELNYTVTKSLLSTLSKKHGIKLSEQPRLNNYAGVKDKVADWYRSASKTKLISHQRIVEKAREVAKELGVDRSFNKYWAANFCKSYGFEFNDQNMAQKAKELRAELKEWYEETSMTEVVSYQTLMEAAKTINTRLEAEVDITKGWVSSFVKINDIRLSEQDSLKSVPKVYDRLNDWYEIESQFRELGAKEIQERVLFLADKYGLARDRVHDHFVAGWQRKFNINLLQSPAKLNRIRERDAFDVEVEQWFHKEIVNRMVSTAEVKKYGEQLISDGRYSDVLVKDKFWHEQLFKRRGISIASQPHYTRKTPSKRKAEALSPKHEPDSFYSSPPKLEILDSSEYHDEPEDLSMPKTKIQKLLKEDGVHSSSPFSMSPSSSPSLIARVSTPPMSNSSNPPWMDEVWEWYSKETKKRILVRSDVHNKGVSLNIGTEISKSWVKNWCRKYKVNFLDQEVFHDIAIIEQKALDWLLKSERPTLGRDDGTRIEDILRKGAAERDISDDFITKKYLERLIKRKSVTKPKAFMQKKFGTMTPEDEDESASFSNFFKSNFTSTNFTDITETVEHKPAEIVDVKEEVNKSPEKKQENGMDHQSMFVMPMDVDEVHQLESDKKETANSKDSELSPSMLKDVLETVKSSGVNLTEEQLLNFIRNGGLQTEVN